MMSNSIKKFVCLPHHQLVLRWNGIVHGPTNGIRAKVMNSSHGGVIVREGLLVGPQFDSLQPLLKQVCGVGCDVECYKKFECLFHHQLVLRWKGIAHGPT